MTAPLTLEVARSWRPAVLAEAADGVESARSEVESHVRAARATMARLAEGWEGAAAQAAAEQMARDVATGFELADALQTARSALRSGATDLGGARDAVLGTVAAIRDAGFAVSADGRVTPPSLPPVLTEPGDPTGAAARRDAQQRALNTQAAGHAESVGAALSLLAEVDRQVADRLAAVPVPQTLGSAVDAYLARALESRDVLAALGVVGAGGVALGQVIQKLVGSATKSGAYLQYLRAATAPITDYATFVRNLDAADTALDTLRFGKADGGILGRVIGQGPARLVGRAFLPLTVLTGGIDAVTGGGYEGARGWATRGFGLAGAGGAAALLIGGAALGPVGVAVAGGAVLAYGLWSVGNLAWDHREEIGEFLTTAGGHVADAWHTTTGAVSDAAEWAGEQVAGAGRAVREAGEAVRDMGKGALDVLSFGLL